VIFIKIIRNKCAAAFASIKSRLILAVLVLVAAILIIGSIAMFGLGQAGKELEALHRHTLTDITQALDLSKRSADLGSSAPYIINLKSPYLITSERNLLLDQLNKISELSLAIQGFPGGEQEYETFHTKLSLSLEKLRQLINGLVSTSHQMIGTRAQIQADTRKLQQLQYRLSEFPNMGTSNAQQRAVYLQTIRNISNLLIAAVSAENYITLGEYRRRYLQLVDKITTFDMSVFTRSVINELQGLAEKDSGIFSIRRDFLNQSLAANNHLFLLKRETKQLNEAIAIFVQANEKNLILHQNRTAASIITGQNLIIFIILFSIIVAISAGLYVTRYVARNLESVADVMKRLADGENEIHMPGVEHRNDEIGKLIRAFHIFQNNASKFDQLNRSFIENSALLQSTFDNMNSGLAVFDHERKLLTWNPRFPEIFEIQGNRIHQEATMAEILEISSLKDFDTPPILDCTINSQTNRDDNSTDQEVRSSSGKIIVIRTSKLPNNATVSLCSDVTERRRFEETFQRFRHLESLGKITGEVAHDFNNLLSVVLGSLQLLRDKIKSPDKSNEYVERAFIAAERGVNLTDRLLAFARKQQLQPEIVELNELLSGMLDLIDFSVDEKTHVQLKSSADNVFVKIDPGQMENAILNLCINSGLAIENTGNITIQLTKSSDYQCEIVVSDDGCGMTEEVLDKIFEPFFTTRKTTEGTGLGLSMVFGFIKQSGGDIRISSQPDEGTTVKMTLPLSKDESTDSTSLQDDEEASTDGNGELVLLVEDLEDVRLAGAQILAKLGYKTLCVDSSSEGIALLHDTPEISVVFTDIYLRDNDTGWELVKAVKEIKPHLPIIVTSGMKNTETLIPDVYKDDIFFLPKPHNKERMKTIFSRALRPQKDKLNAG